MQHEIERYAPLLSALTKSCNKSLSELICPITMVLVVTTAGSSLHRGHLIIRQRWWLHKPSIRTSLAAHSSAKNCLSSSTSQRRRIDDSLSSSREQQTNVITKQTNNNTVDWREYFRSADYDDAWSSYFPITRKGDIKNKNGMIGVGADNNNNHNSSSSEDYQKNIVPSIINGTWIKRRHGMNLEPLCMTYRGVHVEDDYIAAKRRRNTTASQEGDDNNVQNNNNAKEEEEEIQMIIKSQEKVQRMESQTRFLCRMLDDLYRTGIWREVDHPKTERCHRVSFYCMCMK